MENSFLYGGNVHANGIRQHYLRYGPAAGHIEHPDPVIIVPGITSPAATWGFVGVGLGQYFDTYVLDVRGRGLSEAGPSLDYSLDAAATDLIAFAEALGLSRYSVIGHSMGGRIGIRAAAQAPDGLRRLVVVDPPVSGPGRRSYPQNLPWYLDAIRAARSGVSMEAMRPFLPTWTDSQLATRAEWLHTCDERAIIASFNSFHEDDIFPDLPQIKVPLLLMTAGKGDVVRDEDVAEFTACAPQTQHVRIPDAGHMIPFDNEAGFYRGLGDFLGKTVLFL